MSLAELSLRRPVTAVMFYVSLVVIGLIAAFRLPLEQFPDVNVPFIFVDLPYPGSTPEEVERTITRPAEEALATLNDTAFGLGASVWTQDRDRGEAVARKIVAGACFVNAIVRSDVRLPFGGTKASGFGRELAEHGIHEFTNIKTVYVD